jgi:hypothetical protein
MLTDEQRSGSTYVDSIPEPEDKDGYRPVLYYTDADGCYYEYEVIDGE